MGIWHDLFVADIELFVFLTAVVAGAAELADLKDAAEDDSDVQLMRKRFYRTLMSFVRKMMLADKLPRYQAFRNIEAVEDAFRQSERSMNDEAVLSFMLDRIVFPG